MARVGAADSVGIGVIGAGKIAEARRLPRRLPPPEAATQPPAALEVAR